MTSAIPTSFQSRASVGAGPAEPRYCSNCKEWLSTDVWKGNCRLHPWAKDKYSMDATPGPVGCKEYEDKYEAKEKTICQQQ